MSPGDVAVLLTAGGAAGAALLKVGDLLIARGSLGATNHKLNADARVSEQAAASGEVAMLREIIGEVRASEAKKAERIDSLEHRLTLLEERERHALTRAAVHEAWDQMAFAILAQINPEHPPPPPLTLGYQGDHDHPESTTE